MYKGTGISHSMIYVGLEAHDTNKEMRSHSVRMSLVSTDRDVLMEKFARRALKTQREEISV